MLYTIIGGIIGLSMSAIYCETTKTNEFVSGLLIIGGTMFGAGFGASVDMLALMEGKHLVQIIAKKLL